MNKTSKIIDNRIKDLSSLLKVLTTSSRVLREQFKLHKFEFILNNPQVT